MPIHDWTTVTESTFHAFHLTWMGELQGEMNAILPRGYYALAEQLAGRAGPDVLTLADQPDSASNATLTEQETGGAYRKMSLRWRNVLEGSGS